MFPLITALENDFVEIDNKHEEGFVFLEDDQPLGYVSQKILNAIYHYDEKHQQLEDSVYGLGIYGTLLNNGLCFIAGNGGITATFVVKTSANNPINDVIKIYTTLAGIKPDLQKHHALGN